MNRRPDWLRPHTEAASVIVTLAVERAGRRGAMSRDDTRWMGERDMRHYIRLCAREQGITKWSGPAPWEREADDEPTNFADLEIN